MKFNEFIAYLNDPDPAKRISYIRLFGLVEETKAFEAIRGRFGAETDPDVKATLNWAGGRIVAAGKRGYDSLNEIFERYKINQEIENLEDPDEARLIQQMTSRMEMDIHQSKMNAANAQTAQTVGIMAARLAIGGPMSALSGMSGMASGMTPSVDLSSSLGASRPEVGKSRIPAQHPSDTPIDSWFKRMQQDPKPEGRKKILIELMNFNNPNALPLLADFYFVEQDPSVQAEVERVVKVLYLNQLYWDLTQTGTIGREFEKRATTEGKKVTQSMLKTETGGLTDTTEKRTTQESSSEDLAAIMRKAEEARQKRQKR